MTYESAAYCCTEHREFKGPAGSRSDYARQHSAATANRNRSPTAGNHRPLQWQAVGGMRLVRVASCCTDADTAPRIGVRHPALTAVVAGVAARRRAPRASSRAVSDEIRRAAQENSSITARVVLRACNAVAPARDATTTRAAGWQSRIHHCASLSITRQRTRTPLL